MQINQVAIEALLTEDAGVWAANKKAHEQNAEKIQEDARKTVERFKA